LLQVVAEVYILAQVAQPQGLAVVEQAEYLTVINSHLIWEYHMLYQSVLALQGWEHQLAQEVDLMETLADLKVT
jgi:hypothetical protein